MAFLSYNNKTFPSNSELEPCTKSSTFSRWDNLGSSTELMLFSMILDSIKLKWVFSPKLRFDPIILMVNSKMHLKRTCWASHPTFENDEGTSRNPMLSNTFHFTYSICTFFFDNGEIRAAPLQNPHGSPISGGTRTLLKVRSRETISSFFLSWSPYCSNLEPSSKYYEETPNSCQLD